MFVELGYEIFNHMPVYPGLPPVEVVPRESIKKGDEWNGTVFSMYTHAGTHVDAPMHYIDGGPGIDQIPIDRFIFYKPVLLNVPGEAEYLITAEDLKKAGKDKLYTSDILFINTGYWKLRENQFNKYKDNYPALSPEAAEFIRAELPEVKAVAIDTLSIENLKQGAVNGYKTHRTLLDPDHPGGKSVLIFEDYNPQPLLGRTLKSAFTSPLRIKGREASPVNIIVEVD